MPETRKTKEFFYLVRKRWHRTVHRIKREKAYRHHRDELFHRRSQIHAPEQRDVYTRDASILVADQVFSKLKNI